mgnify:CR=1 FL=1
MQKIINKLCIPEKIRHDLKQDKESIHVQESRYTQFEIFSAILIFIKFWRYLSANYKYRYMYVSCFASEVTLLSLTSIVSFFRFNLKTQSIVSGRWQTKLLIQGNFGIFRSPETSDKYGIS